MNYDRLTKQELIKELMTVKTQLSKTLRYGREIPRVGENEAKLIKPKKSGRSPFPAGQTTERQYRVKDEGGTVRQIYEVVKDVHDENGTPRYTEGALYEIKGKDSPTSMTDSVEQTEIICRFRPDGTLTYVNEAYCRYFGCTRQDLKDRNFLFTISEQDREKVFSKLKNLKPEQAVGIMECRVKTSFGEILWNQWSYRAIFDGEGHILEYHSVGRDITYRKYMQDVLEKRAAILKAITCAAEGFLKSDSWSAKIGTVLESFGRATGSSHVFLFENDINRDEGISVRQRFEWFSPAISRVKASKRFLKTRDLATCFSRWVFKKSEGKPIYGAVGQFPNREAEFPALEPTFSVAVVPILVGDRWWGFVGLADYLNEIVWTDEEIALLEAAAGILGAAIERDETEQILKKSERQLRASENRYRELADTIPVGIFESSLNGIVTYANRTAMEMFGYGEDDLRRGIPFLKVIAPKDHETAIGDIRGVLSGEALLCCEYTLVSKSGTHFTGLVMARPMMKDGQAVGTTSVVSDISNLKEAQEALRKSEALLQGILRAAPIGIGIVQDRVIGWVNDYFTRMTAYASEDLIGESTRILYADDWEFERVGRETDVEIQKGKTCAVETKWRRKDGTVFDLYLSSNAIDPQDLTGGVVFTAFDITDQKKAADILWFVNEKLEKQVTERTRDLDIANMLLRIELEEHRKTEEALVKNEQLYRAIVEDQTELICRFYPDGTLSFVNETFCRYFGKSRGELMETVFHSAIQCQDREIITKNAEALTPENNIAQFEIRMELPDKGLRWMSWTIRATYDEIGRLIEYQAAGRDVTERILLQHQIQESRNMLRSVFDGISDPLVMVGEDLTVIMLNRAALEFFDVGHYRKLIGLPCLGHLIERYGREQVERIKAVIGESIPSRLDLTANLKAIRYEEVSVYPIRGVENGKSLAIIRVTDRTKQIIMERELIQNEKLASLGLLISGIVHEINNPNNFIVFNIPILHDYLKEILPVVDDYAEKTPMYEVSGMPYPDFRVDILKLLENIEHGSHRINVTVAKLKEFSRKNEDKGLRVIAPSEVVDKALSICNTQIRKTVKKFDVDIDPGLPMMTTNPDAIEQVLINLLINAAQAANKEDSLIRLHVFKEDSWQKRLVMEVIDNGCGMDATTASRIFDPFFTTKEEEYGTGLGLYISKNLVESAGGSISLESKPGRGTIFRVIFPDLESPGGREKNQKDKGVSDHE